MKKGLICISILLLCISATPSSKAQSTQQVVQYINWAALFSSPKFNEHAGLAFDAQFRFVNGFESMQHLVRIGPELYVTPFFSIVPVGYAYVWNYPYEQNPLPYAENEHRVWEQFLFRHEKGRVQFQHRFRIEQRFIQHLSFDSLSQSVVDSGYTRYRNRIRYRFMMNIALNRPKMGAGAWYVQAWDEYFFSFADGIDPNRQHQNRLFAGVGYQVAKSFTFNLGLLYHMQMKRNGNLVEHNLGPLLSVFYNPDLSAARKKKKKE